MKKKLLFTCLLGILIPICSYGQGNLLINGDFEEPGDGKYRGDCQADGCFDENVPGWYADEGVTDAGVEPDPARGAYAAFAFSGDDGHIYQVVGEIEEAQRDFKLTYWAKITWSSAAAETPDEISYVTYFYSFEGTDTSSKEILDSLAFIDTGWDNDEVARDTNYYMYEHSFVVPSSEVGKNFAVGFDIVATNGAADASSAWAHFDDMELTVAEVTGISNSNIDHSLLIYPNPSQGMVRVESPASLIQKIEVIDITGEIILTQTNNNMIDLTTKSKGVYFLRATTSSNNIILKKLIIE